MQVFGLAPEAAPCTDEEEEQCFLWPCNVITWGAWYDVQTQWRIGMSGATGLDYAGVRAYLDELGHHGEDRREIFSGIQAAERAALDVWSAKAKQRP